MHKSLKLLLLIACVAALPGCGFALRGSVDLPPELQTLGLESADGNSDMVRALRRALAASDITLVDEADGGPYVLGIGSEQTVERVLSVNENARAGEYELSVSIPFQLRSGTGVVLGPETLRIDKVYLADPNSAVAKAEERELLQAEMRRELVNQIMRRLQAVRL